MNENQTLMAKLQEARQNGGGIVTYTFTDGTKKQQPLQDDLFKSRSTGDALKVLNETMHDYGAVSFDIN